MVNFIDSIVNEYEYCQSMCQNSSSDPVIKLIPRPSVPQVQQSELLHKRTFQFHQTTEPSKKARKVTMVALTEVESEIKLYLPPAKLPLAPAQTNQETLFFRNAPLPLFDTIEKLKGLYLKRLFPFVFSKIDVEKIACVGEMLLQGVLTHENGLHLVIAPKDIIADMGNILLNEVFGEGMHTAWQLAESFEEETQRYEKFAAYFHSTLKLLDCGNCDEWIARVFSLLDQFPVKLIRIDSQVINKKSLLLIRKFAMTHLSTIHRYIREPMEAEIVFDGIMAAIKKAQDVLPATEDSIPPESMLAHFKQNLIRASSYLEGTESPNMDVIYNHIDACYIDTSKLKILERSHHPIILARYIMTASLLAIDPRRFDLPSSKDYPSSEQFSRLLTFSPIQFYTHLGREPLSQILFSPDLKNKNVILLASPESLGNFDFVKAGHSLASLQMYSHEKSNAAEYVQMAALSKKICALSRQLHPQAPQPYTAAYVENLEFLTRAGLQEVPLD